MWSDALLQSSGPVIHVTMVIMFRWIQALPGGISHKLQHQANAGFPVTNHITTDV